MATSNRSAFEQLLDKYEPVLKAAFLDAIADIRSQVTLKLLVERLEHGDVAGALDVLQIERAAFGPLELASPGVITWTAHALAANTPIVFSTTGALPTGLTAGTTYYVKTVLDANTFTVSATSGGTVINTSSVGSGVHTTTTQPVPSKRFFIGLINGATEGFGGPNNVRQLQATVKPNTNTVRVAPLG